MKTVPTGTSASLNSSASALPELQELEPIERVKRRWPTYLGVIVTLAMIAGLVRKLFEDGLSGLQAAVPESPLFYIAFLAAYFVLPLGDWVIFRRLWTLPVSGIVPIIKKTVANDVVFGYSGEVYFYAWARQHANLSATPFGAVKDVSILSAIAGNAFTIGLLVLAIPFASLLMPWDMAGKVALSAAVILGISLLFVLFGKRVFSLSRKLLWWVFGVHMARSVAQQVFTAAAWYFALPDVPIGIWLVLCAARMLVGRLPFLPNKEALFWTFALLLVGHDDALTDMLAFAAALTLLVHVILFTAVTAMTLIRKDG